LRIPLTTGESPAEDVLAALAPTTAITEGASTVTLTPPPKSPTVAIGRVLRRLGLAQGRGGDFRVTGFYRDRERDHTYVILYTRRAEETVAARADAIEQAPELGGFVFTVSVRYAHGRPVTTIRNGACERVREQPPALDGTEGSAESDDTGTPVAGEGAEEAPPVRETWRERWRREEQAKALGWSTQQAEAVRRAASGTLFRDGDGLPRHVTRPGRAGARVAAARIASLEAAGFLATVANGDSEGPSRIEATADGVRALAVWDSELPQPAPHSRKRERMKAAPLLFGQEWRRRREDFLADEERRRIEREKRWAEWEVRQAEEEREERRWKAWAVVEGIRYSWRKRPRGWVPTDEQIRRYSLDPEVVAELRAEAAELATEQAPADGAAPEDRGEEQAGTGDVEPELDAELWNAVPGIVAGPGVVVPGLHVEYLPEHRPGPRTRHPSAGEISSVGTTHVRWRPYKWHQDVRTPLAHMRINAVMHVNQAEDVRRKVAALESGVPFPRWPSWWRWSLFRHLKHAERQRPGTTADVPFPRSPCAPSDGVAAARKRTD
jgi:hypothetical protein